MFARRLVDDDSGFALAAVMAAIALITAIAIGGFYIAQSTLGESDRVQHENRAYQAAASGLDRELSQFDIAKFNQGQYPTPLRTINGGDTYYVNVTRPPASTSYTMWAYGESNGITETVKVQFEYFDLWDMNVSGGANSWVGSRNGFNGNAIVIGSMYVNGDLDWTASSALYGGPLMVANGTADFTGSGDVGPNVDIYLDNPAAGPNASDVIAVNNLKESGAPEFELPTLDAEMMADFEANAGTVINGDLTIGGASFGDPATDAFWYDDATNTLHCDEIVYIKGMVSTTEPMTYTGRGILCAEGKSVSGVLTGFEIGGRFVPSGPWETLYGYTLPKCNTNATIGLISPGAIRQDADWMSCAIYINGPYTTQGGGVKDSFRGSIIADNIDFTDTNCILSTQVGLGAMLRDEMRRLGSGLFAQGDWVRQ